MLVWLFSLGFEGTLRALTEPAFKLGENALPPKLFFLKGFGLNKNQIFKTII